MDCKSISQNTVFNNELNSMHLNNKLISINAYLNTNSLRNKFEFLVKFVRDKVDILMILKTKIVKSRALKDFSNKFLHVLCLH